VALPHPVTGARGRRATKGRAVAPLWQMRADAVAVCQLVSERGLELRDPKLHWETYKPLIR
jgi:hypothetical protein